MTAAARAIENDTANSESVLRRGLALMSPADRRLATRAFLASLMSAATSALLIWAVIQFMGLLFDPAAAEKDKTLQMISRLAGGPGAYALFLLAGAGCAVLALAVLLLQLIQVKTTSDFSAGMTCDLGRRLLETYLRQPYEFFIDRHRSDLSTGILSEAETAVSQVYRPALQLATALPTTLAVICVLALVDTAVVIYLGGGILVVYGCVFFFVRRQIRQLGHRRAAANQKRFRAAGDGLQSIKDVKILGLEAPYLERYDVSAREMRDVTVSSQILSSVPVFALRATLLFGGIVFLLLYIKKDAYLGGSALSGVAPALGALVVAAQRLLPELQRIIESTLRLQYGIGALDRLHADLMHLRPVADSSLQDRLRLTTGITFQNVTYSYPGAARVGLSDITLDIRAGEKIGIVGRSGAGKTTLGDLALGLLAPCEGRLLVDGTEVTEPLRGAWRQSVGFVPQDIFLIDASVSQNIALGLESGQIDMARVQDSARLARIDSFVTETLPEGYDTMIGERGVRLSGGQRQRLAIARALYRDADMIVFDEATSALDTGTEEEVMTSLRDLPGTKTILVIAHRLSTLNVCDRILVLSYGRIAGIGTRAELEATCPAFRDLLPADRAREDEVIL